MKILNHTIEKVFWFAKGIWIYCRLSQVYNFCNIKGTIIESKRKSRFY